jgi:hypothetical protein
MIHHTYNDSNNTKIISCLSMILSLYKIVFIMSSLMLILNVWYTPYDQYLIYPIMSLAIIEIISIIIKNYKTEDNYTRCIIIEYVVLTIKMASAIALCYIYVEYFQYFTKLTKLFIWINMPIQILVSIFTMAYNIYKYYKTKNGEPLLTIDTDELV